MKILVAILNSFLLLACDNINSNLPPPQDGGNFFYPNVGQAVVYDVEETQYELTGKFTLKTYQLKFYEML